MSVAHEALIEALPPGTKPPSCAFIRRAAQRGNIRILVLGGTRHMYNLDDVRALVIGGDR